MFGPISACLRSIRRHPLRFGLLACVVGLLFFFGWRHVGAWLHWIDSCKAEEQADYAGAREHLAVCLDIWPGSASTHLMAARTAHRCGQFQDAQALLTRAQELGAPAERVVLERYLVRAKLGDLGSVEAKLLAFLRKGDPDSFLILDVLTKQWLDDFRLAEALTYLELWLKKQPDDREALLRRGLTLERMANLADAIACYRKVLELDPERDQRNKDPVRLQLAELLLQKNQAAEALEHLLVLEERQPHNPKVLLGLARCWSGQGQPEKAALVLTGLLKARPKDPQVLFEQGKLYLESPRADLAEPFLRQAAQLSPWDRQIVYLLSQCLDRLKKHEEAKLYQDRLQQIRRDEKAMRVLMEEVMRSPRDASLRCQIGEIFLRNGMTSEAERWLLSALHYDPEYEPARKALVKHREKAGRKEE